jgi:hypothetical protein
MSVICLQWIARYRLSQNVTVKLSPQHVVTPSSQLSSILGLLRLSPSITSPLPNDELRDRSNLPVAGVHPDLYRNLPTLPIMSQSAILRAYMTVFGVSATSLHFATLLIHSIIIIKSPAADLSTICIAS